MAGAALHATRSGRDGAPPTRRLTKSAGRPEMRKDPREYSQHVLSILAIVVAVGPKGIDLNPRWCHHVAVIIWQCLAADRHGIVSSKVVRPEK